MTETIQKKADDPGEENRKLTLGTVVSYGWGIISLLTALILLPGSPIGGAVMVVASLVLIPITRRSMFGLANVSLSRWLVTFLYIAIWLLGSFLYTVGA